VVGFSSSLTADWDLPSSPCHVDLSSGQLTAWTWVSPQRKQEERERDYRKEGMVFYKLMFKVRIHHFLLCFVVRSRFLGQGERVTHGHQSQEDSH
jgi:hypothetical protein